jgi:hypothetical protein
MRVLVVVLSLTMCAAGCAKKAPETPQPAPATAASNPPKSSEPDKPSATPPPTAKDEPTQEAAKPPAPDASAEKPAASGAKPAAPATPSKPAVAAQPAEPTTPSTADGKPAPAKPAPSTPTPTPATPPRQTAAKPAAPAARPPSPTLDLTALKEQLKSTKAIGLMTKLSLKNQVDDLLDGFRDHYAGKGKSTVPQLRQTYDMLMMKVLSLLQDKDQKLASDIVASREVIWALLADPKKFAALDV